MPWLLLLLLQLLHPGAFPFCYCQSQVYVLLGWQGWCTEALLKMLLALETNQRQPRAAVVDQQRPFTCRPMRYIHLAVKLAVEGKRVGDATLQYVPCRACTYLAALQPRSCQPFSFLVFCCCCPCRCCCWASLLLLLLLLSVAALVHPSNVAGEQLAAAAAATCIILASPAAGHFFSNFPRCKWCCFSTVLCCVCCWVRL